MSTEMERWITGHHLFIVFIQGIVLSLSRLQIYLQQGNLIAAKKELQDTSALLSASGSSMKLAADFPQAQYMDVIRPSMPDFFSGLDMIDHKNMVQQMRQITPYLQHIPLELHKARAKFYQSVAQAYDSHIYVCDKFVQDEHSLRVISSKTTAKKTLLIIKKQRLCTLGVDSLKVDSSICDKRTN